MSLTTRAKNILLSPKSEWAAISGETDTPQSLLGKYVIPMALIPAIALFIGYGLIGYNVLGIRIGGGIRWGVIMGLNNFIGSIIAYFLCTYVVDALAPSFSSAKNIGRSAQLVAYSYTAVWVAGIFYIIPYLGIPAMKGTPEDKQVTYMIVSAIVIIVIGFVVNMIITRIVFAVTGNPFLGAGGIDIHL